MTTKDLASMPEMGQSPSGKASASGNRYAWVDCAKGICIISVVALWVDRILELDQGWLHTYVIFAKPFRMPDFFLLSGLFLHRVISKPWRNYLDTKVVHYMYFLLLWTVLLLVGTRWLLHPPAGVVDAGLQYLEALYQPIGMLWFILMLPVYFVVTRLTQRVPGALMLAISALLMIFPAKTGIPPIDWFGEYYVYFYAGYLFSARIFHLGDWVGRHPRRAIAGVIMWLVLNSYLTVELRMGWSDHLALSLVLGFVGILAIISISKLISGYRQFGWLSYLGKNSIVVYLGFYIPLIVINFVGRRASVDLKSELTSTAVWAFCIAISMLVYWTLRDSRLYVLYRRPEWAKIG